MFKRSITAPMTLAGLACLMIGVANAQPANDAPPPRPDGVQQAPQGDGGDRPGRPGMRQGGDGPRQQRGDFSGGPIGNPRMMPPGGMPGMDNIQMQDATYLGVEVSPIDPAMKSQLKLTKTDSGLMVNFVAAESPAKAAGLQQYDVLTKVDDQILFNPPQLQSLVRIHKAADEIKITYIREGTTNTTSAKLITKEQMVAPMFGGGWGGGGGGGGMMGGPTAEMQERMRQMTSESTGSNRTVTYEAEDMSLTLQVENGKPILTAKDKTGKELFNGAIETPEQRAAIPAEVRKGLDKVAVNYLITSLSRTGRPMGYGGGSGQGRGGMGGGGMGRGGMGGGAMGPNRGPGQGPVPDRQAGGPDR